MLTEHHPDPTVVREARKAMMSTGAQPLAGEEDGPEVYQLKVTLRGVRPPVWRRIQVPAAISLAQLHDVIQTVMGWTDSHLHLFEADDLTIGVPDPEYGQQVVDERGVRLHEVLDTGDRMTYTYDFGDDWLHEILVEQVIPLDPDVQLPRCLAGRRACPPEDVGGPWATSICSTPYATRLIRSTRS